MMPALRTAALTVEPSIKDAARRRERGGCGAIQSGSPVLLGSLDAANAFLEFGLTICFPFDEIAEGLSQRLDRVLLKTSQCFLGLPAPNPVSSAAA